MILLLLTMTVLFAKTNITQCSGETILTRLKAHSCRGQTADSLRERPTDYRHQIQQSCRCIHVILLNSCFLSYSKQRLTGTCVVVLLNLSRLMSEQILTKHTLCSWGTVRFRLE